MARWQPVPIVGGAYSDDSKPWSAQDCVNFIVTPAERGGTRSPGKLTCLPGYTTFCATMQEAPVRGLHDVEGLLLAVTGDTLYRIGTDGAATAIGTIPGVGRVSIAHNQVTYGHEVMIANGQSGYVYNTYTGAFGQVTDDGFSGFTVCDFVDGYIAGTDPQGRFWAHGMLRQAGEFNTLDQYDSEAAPDKVRSLIVSHREVMILNQRTASFSINTGAATGTFQNSNGTEMDVGIASPWARARLDNTVYWLGHDGIVYRLSGHSPQRVSTGPIEQAISRCDMSKAFAFTFEDRGHKVFYLTFPDGQTWGYDVWTNEWHRRQSKDLNRWRIDALVKWNGVWIAGDFSNGKLYQLDWAVQSEAGEEMERRRISAVLHDNGNRVTVNAVKIEVDTGLGNDSAPRPTPLLPSLALSGDFPDSFVGDAGTYQYGISGGVQPYTAVIGAGELPPGATMDSDGLVTYDLATEGSYSWTVTVTDYDGTVVTLEDSAEVTIAVIISAASQSAAASTSIGLAMPATVGAGDYLLAIVAINSNATITMPTGWTEIVSRQGLGRRISALARVADGTEGGTTVTLTLAFASAHAARIYRIASNSFVSAFSGDHGDYPAGTAPLPPAHTPPLGLGDYAVFTAFGLGTNSATTTVYPYSEQQDSTALGTSVLLGSCVSERVTADALGAIVPGPFGISAATAAGLVTLALRRST